MRGMLMADFNRHRRSAGELREGGGAQARLQQGALGRRAWRRCRSSTPKKSQIATQRADYERRLRALRAAYEAGHIPGDMSKGLGMGAAVLPRLSRPQRSRSAAPVRRPRGAHHGRPLRHGRARSAARAGRAGPRRHRQRLFLPALGLEDRRQGLGHRNSTGTLPGVRLSHRHRSRMPRRRSPGRTATASCKGRTRPRRGGRSSSPTGRTF